MNRRIEFIETPEGLAKKCRDCSVIKLITEFYFNKNRGRPQSYCKKCSQSRADATRAKNREPDRARSRLWKARNPEKSKRSARNAHLFNRYGIGVPEYEAMLARCGERCEICGERPEDALCVDHCHSTGEIRGILCSGCNKALGSMRDDPARLMKAAEYLRTRSPIHQNCGNKV